MRGRPSFLREALTIPALLSLASVSLSCSSSTPTGTAGLTLAPTILVPKDLIDQIAVFSLQVYAANAADGGSPLGCNATTGNVTGDVATATSLLPGSKADGVVSTTACAPGVTRCFAGVTVTQSTTIERVFSVIGYGDKAMTNPLGYGCAEQFVTGTSLSLSLKLIAIPASVVCGDGILQPPETCDPGSGADLDGGTCSANDPVCCSCQTTEEVLSTGSGPSGSITVTGASTDKSNPSFSWPLGSNFLAFFTDASSGMAQVSMRLLGSALAPTSTSGMVAETESLYLPNTPGVFPAKAAANNQKQPVAVETGGITYVVFADDTNNTSANDDFQIRLRSMDASLNALQTSACNISDGTAGESGSQTSPAAALSTNASSLFVAWQDNLGNIYGRTYTPNASGACGSLGTQELLSTGSSNSNVSVATIPTGWVVVWQSGTDIVVRPIGTTGAPAAAPQTVQNTGHSGATPTIAALASGSGIQSANVGAFAVVWSDQANGSSTNTIFAQRYDQGGTSLESPTQISESANGGGEISPFITTMPTVGGSYVVAWVDQGTNAQVRGRFLAGTSGSLANATGAAAGYLQNAVDGTTGEFQASVASGRARATPTVTAGGGLSGGQAYIAFGWADNSSTAPYGIIARRFPLPTQ